MEGEAEINESARETAQQLNLKATVSELARLKDIAWVGAAAFALVYAIGWLARYAAIANLGMGSVDSPREAEIAIGLIAAAAVAPFALIAPIFHCGSFDQKCRRALYALLFYAAITACGSNAHIPSEVADEFWNGQLLYLGVLLVAGLLCFLQHHSKTSSRRPGERGEEPKTFGMDVSFSIVALFSLAVVLLFGWRIVPSLSARAGGFAWNPVKVEVADSMRIVPKLMDGSLYLVLSDNQGVILARKRTKQDLLDDPTNKNAFLYLRLPWSRIKAMYDTTFDAKPK